MNRSIARRAKWREMMSKSSEEEKKGRKAKAKEEDVVKPKSDDIPKPLESVTVDDTPVVEEATVPVVESGEETDIQPEVAAIEDSVDEQTADEVVADEVMEPDTSVFEPEAPPRREEKPKSGRSSLVDELRSVAELIREESDRDDIEIEDYTLSDMEKISEEEFSLEEEPVAEEEIIVEQEPVIEEEPVIEPEPEVVAEEPIVEPPAVEEPAQEKKKRDIAPVFQKTEPIEEEIAPAPKPKEKPAPKPRTKPGRKPKRTFPASDLFDSVVFKLVGVDYLRRDFLRRCKGLVLEVAGGAGGNLRFYRKDSHVIFTAYRPSRLRKAKRKAKARTSGVMKFTTADVNTLPFPDNTFDSVVSTFNLCAFDDPVSALKEMSRVCKPVGRLMLFEHGVSTSRFINVLLNIHENLWHRMFRGCHLTRDPRTLAEEAGLQIRNVERIGVGLIHWIEASPSE